MAFRVEIWGDYACFSRPELKVERVSYDVITPSAARGILDAIYWHPGLRWIVDKIYVVNPIIFTNIRRNEVKSKASKSNARSAMRGAKQPLFIDAHNDIVQRAAMVLQNVRYILDAHFELVPEKMSPSDNEGKFADTMRRRLENGQCYHQPCMGVREFPACFAAWKGNEPLIAPELQNAEKDLGIMLYDMDYSDPQNITATFFRAVLKNGCLDLRNCEVLR